jgi:N-acetylglucosamine-6-sulfatase
METSTNSEIEIQPSKLKKVGLEHFILVAIGTALVVFLMTTASELAKPTPAQAVGQPNILLFITDNQDARSMDEVMDKVNQHLVQLGTKFTNAHIPHPLCCPSRSSILTGQFNHNNGVLGNTPPDGGISKLNQAETLAVWLQNAGYYTGLIGKYLNDYGLTDTNTGDSVPACQEVPPGWDEWYGLVDNKARPNDYALNENGQVVMYGTRTLPPECNATSTPSVYETDLFSQKTVDFLNRRASATDGKPFFFYVSFDTPHMSQPADRHIGTYSTRPLPTPPSFNEADVSDKPQFIKNKALLTTAEIDTLTNYYHRRLEALLAVDEAVEAAVNALVANGQIDNTVVIFMSDQGEMLGEHRTKGVLYAHEESIKIPFVIKGPNIPANATNNSLISNIDIAGTILELAQANAGVVMDGRSFVSLLTNPATPWRTTLLLDARGDGAIGQNYKGVRTTQYMYNEYPNGDKELYDLVADPYQLVSKATVPAYASVVAELASRMNSLKTCTGNSCWVTSPEPMPDTTAPTVSLTSPVNGATVPRGTNVTIAATAADNVAVTKVEFYVKNVLKCTDVTAPYSCVWTVPNQKNTPYTLHAKAFDTSNNTTTSATVNVTAN